MGELAAVLFDRSNHGLCLVGQDGTVLRANRVLERQMHFPSREMAGKSILELFGNSDGLVAAIFHCLTSVDEDSGRSLPVMLGAGLMLWECDVTHVRLPDGTAGALVGLKSLPVAAPVTATDGRSLKDDLRRCQAQVESIARSLSHDLRSPLAVIQAHAQYMERSMSDAEESGSLRKSIRSILAAAGQINSLIGEFVERSRADSESILWRNGAAEAAGHLPQDEETLV